MLLEGMMLGFQNEGHSVALWYDWDQGLVLHSSPRKRPYLNLCNFLQRQELRSRKSLPHSTSACLPSKGRGHELGELTSSLCVGIKSGLSNASMLPSL